MRSRRLATIVVVLAALALACSGGPVSLDAGPPPRPVLFEVEGLKWGMTPEEVRAAWGPGREGDVYYYEKKAGYPGVSLGFNGIPPDMIVHKDAKLTPGKPGQFLASVNFQGDTSMTREKVRADLVSRFGPPLADAKLNRVHRCEAPRCDLFRAAECTLVQAQWNPAVPEVPWPEHLGSVTYRLAPSSLVSYVPRTEWSKLRGAVPTSLAADFPTRLDGQPRGANAASTRDLVKALGRPNLYLEEAPGKGRLFYAFLDDSVFVVRISEGKLDGSEGSFSTN